VGTQGFYMSFGGKVGRMRSDLVRLLPALKAQYKRVVGYGASAKGCTLVPYCGITLETLDYVVDRSPFKQGHFTPGIHLPIHPPAK
jgi:hypothetical protein